MSDKPRRRNPSQIFRISLDYPLTNWRFPMPVDQNDNVRVQIPSSQIVETILAALYERKNVLVYGRPGMDTSQLLRGVQAQSPVFYQGVQIERLSNGSTFDAKDSFSTLRPNFGKPTDLRAGETDADDGTPANGMLVGLTAATSRRKAFEHWGIFCQEAPDLVIEITSPGVFYDVTVGNLRDQGGDAP